MKPLTCRLRRSENSSTFTRFSAKGRPFTTASCARRTLAAATSFMASVIFLVFDTDPIRSRISLSPAQTCAHRKGTACRTPPQQSAAPRSSRILTVAKNVHGQDLWRYLQAPPFLYYASPRRQQIRSISGEARVAKFLTHTRKASQSHGCSKGSHREKRLSPSAKGSGSLRCKGIG